MAGRIGFVTVAVVFAVAHVIAGRFPFYTSALADLADREWQLWFVAFFFFLFFSVHLEGAVQAFAAPMRSALSDAAIWGAGIAASAAMAGFLLWMHPKIRARQSW